MGESTDVTSRRRDAKDGIYSEKLWDGSNETPEEDGVEDNGDGDDYDTSL